MATFKSDLITGRVPKVYRGLRQGHEFELTGVIALSVGTVLTSGDLLKFMRVGENVRVDELILNCDTDLDPTGTLLAGSIGYFQALNVAGTALVVDAKTGTTYTSPATSAAAYVAASATIVGLNSAGTTRWVRGQAALDNEFATVVDPFAGPVDIGITLTGTGTALAAAGLLRLTGKFTYKEAEQGEFRGDLADAYINRYTTAGSSQGLKS